MDAVIPGVGDDAPMEVNQFGGRQSKMEYDFTQLDPLAMFQRSRPCEKRYRTVSDAERRGMGVCTISSTVAKVEMMFGKI